MRPQRWKKILAPTDLSFSSVAGIRYAMELASVRRIEVIVFHVAAVQPPSTDPAGLIAAFSLFPQAAGGARHGEGRPGAPGEFVAMHFAHMLTRIRWRSEVACGVPYKKIVEKAVEENVDLIVMSPRGETASDPVDIGHVAGKVVARAPCPVLLCPGESASRAVPKGFARRIRARRDGGPWPSAAQPMAARKGA